MAKNRDFQPKFREKWPIFVKNGHFWPKIDLDFGHSGQVLRATVQLRPV
jgi:hypothetical protein